LLAESDIAFLEGVSPDLHKQLRNALEWSPLAATVVDGAPVSLCYTGALTETLWDISIHTLEAYRGRGFAVPCIAYMVGHMRERKKEPMWSAFASNRASLRLAAKLGFVEVDRMAVFLPPGSADLRTTQSINRETAQWPSLVKLGAD